MTDLDMDTITGAVAGDPRAVAELLATVRPVVARYCFGRVPSRPDLAVEDVVQEVLLAVVGALPSFEARSIEQFMSWVFTIAYRHVVDLYRRPRRETPVEDLTAVMTYLSPERVQAGREDLAALGVVMQGLSQLQRDVVWLSAQGLRWREAAVVLDRPEVSLRVAHHRAMKVLEAWRAAE